MRPLTAAITGLQFISFSPHQSPRNRREFLFAGIGNQVCVFSQDNLESPVTRKEIFEPSLTIHGFSTTSTTDNLVAVHAGRQVTVVQLLFKPRKNEVEDIKVKEVRLFDDWVWHCKWVDSSDNRDNQKLIVAAGYSKIYICDKHLSVESVARPRDEYNELTWSSTIFTSHNQDNTMYLYNLSANFFGHIYLHSICSRNDVLNNPVGKIVMDTYDLGQKHNGPVMNMKVSDDLGKLVSVSVDRTIRVWIAKPSSSWAFFPLKGCFMPLIAHYGHVARIWDVQFIAADAENQPNYDDAIVSVGEDRTCRIWSSTEASKQLALFRCHTGRNVWSVAASRGSDGKTERKHVILSTGGEDGCIKSQKLPLPLNFDSGNDNNDNFFKKSFKLPGNFKNPRKVGCSNDESARTLFYLNDNLLLLTTDFGRILAVKFGRDSDEVWTQILKDDRGIAFTPSSLTVLNTETCTTEGRNYNDVLICAGQTSGDVFVIPLRLSHDDSHRSGIVQVGSSISFCALLPTVQHASTMVMSLFSEDFCSIREQGAEHEVVSENECGNTHVLDHVSMYGDLFVVCPSGNLYQWQLSSALPSLFSNDDISTDGKQAIDYTFIGRYEVHRSSKTTLVTSICLLRDRNLLITGDKGGRIHLYLTPTTCSLSSSGDKTIHSHSWLRMHGDRVSCIKLKDDKNTILSSGFDGVVHNFTISNDSKIQMKAKQKTIEQTNTIMDVTEDDKIVGFKGKMLSIWDLKLHVELFRYDVGNWRRANVTKYSNRSINLSFWRAGKLYIIRKTFMLNDRLLCGGVEFHGGRANGVCTVQDNSNDSQFIIITCGEDTVARITKLTYSENGGDDTGELKWVQRLQGHISCVNDVSFHMGDGSIASAGGSDELLIWSRDATDHGGKIRSSKHVANSAWKLSLSVNVGELLATCGNAVSRKQNKATNPNVTINNSDSSDGEEDTTGREALMRVTSVDCMHGGPTTEGATWAVGRSDGSVVRVTYISGQGADAQLLGRHDNEAVLCVLGLPALQTVLSGGSGGSVHLCGSVAGVWREHHNGGVNCLCATQTETETGPGATTVVVSGGDDETVRARLLGPGDAVTALGRGHTAAVTGVAAVQDVPGYVVSAGADQRVILWRVVVSTEGHVQLEELRVARCAVPDVGGVDLVLRQGHGQQVLAAVVCGYGLEVIDFELPSFCAQRQGS